jgi:hypothetical protein
MNPKPGAGLPIVVVVARRVVVGAGLVVVTDGVVVVVTDGRVVVGAGPVVVGAGPVVVGATMVVVVVVVGAPSTRVDWIAGFVPTDVHVCAPRPATFDAIDVGPDHEIVWPAMPDFKVVLMLIKGRDTALDCTGPVKTTDTLRLSAATVYAPVRLPPEKVTLSSAATCAGAGITSVIELIVTVSGMLGEPDWTSSVTSPPSTAGSGVSDAVTLTSTLPTIGQVTDIAVVVVSALAPRWARKMTTAPKTSVAAIMTDRGRQPTARRDRMLMYFPLVGGVVPPLFG